MSERLDGRSMTETTYKLWVHVPAHLTLPAETEVGSRSGAEGGAGAGEKQSIVDREMFYEQLWARYQSQGFIGVHEGTVLSDDAAQQGLETESWTLDAAEAPRDRDWVGDQSEILAELYFDSVEAAQKVESWLKQIPELQLGSIQKQEPQDWDAEWKASFLGAGNGIQVPPFWRIVPPWVTPASEELETVLKVNPGAGFGTGTHETTQLCLEALGNYSNSQADKEGVFQEQQGLDFGSGSGILAIAMARLGAKVDAVEIDSLAIDNATENARLNGVEDRIAFHRTLLEENDFEFYRVVVANILRPVLLEFAEPLVKRLHPQGLLVLSGLIESDVNSVLDRYTGLFKKYMPSSPKLQVLEKGEWRALVFDLGLG